jgi:hypothetical protein
MFSSPFAGVVGQVEKMLTDDGVVPLAVPSRCACVPPDSGFKGVWEYHFYKGRYDG